MQAYRCALDNNVLNLPPTRLTWNLQITHLERKMTFQTSMIMFHVNLQGCMNRNPPTKNLMTFPRTRLLKKKHNLQEFSGTLSKLFFIHEFHLHLSQHGCFGRIKITWGCFCLGFVWGDSSTDCTMVDHHLAPPFGIIFLGHWVTFSKHLHSRDTQGCTPNNP